MNNVNDAVIVLSKCVKTHRTFGIRAEKISRNHWTFTWAFPIKEASAQREGYDRTTVNGEIDFSDEYPGCPYCGDDSGFILCPRCNKISCGYESERIWPCDWCGNVASGISDYTGEDIRAGMDR